MQIVEAAHIWPYRGTADHAPTNGLLLRADIHTLFDLDLIGVEPGTLKISLSPLLAGSAYQIFHGKTLKCSQLPNDEALQLRWKSYLEEFGQ